MTRSHTSWTRLEPIARNAEMTETLRAEVHDPLWMLARQWQLGEFRAEDGGSPIHAELDVEHDHFTRFRLGDGPPQDYDGEPLEAVVEREPEVVGERPHARVAGEAGMQFLRLLDRHGFRVTGDDGDERPYVAADFPASLHLDVPTTFLDAPGQRYASVMDGRTLDGYEVFTALESAVETIDTTDGSWSDVTVADLPLPTDASFTDPPAAYEAAATDYYAWYRDIYTEPTAETGSAWDPDRMEYRFEVATGVDEHETVFEAAEYPGGRLDWYAFSVADSDQAIGPGPERPDDPSSLDASADDGDGRDEHTETTVASMPTPVRFPGMPAPRWWEFEDGAVSLDDIPIESSDFPWLQLIEFAVVYGNDWFTVPVDVPVGSLTRIPEVRVTDTFGQTTTLAAATPDEPAWNLFMYDELPDRVTTNGEPGLLVPPVMTDGFESDPVERVVFARDEMANMAWAIEETVEGELGDPINRLEFGRADVVVEDIQPAETADEEYVEFANPGEAPLDVSGWTLAVTYETDDGEATETVTLAFDAELPPEGSIRLYTGTAPAPDHESLDLDTPILDDAESISVYDGPVADDHLVTRRMVETAPIGEALPAYRLASDVLDHWFPLVADPEAVADSSDAYRLTLALLLDADLFAPGSTEPPRPRGEILVPASGDRLSLYEEEVSRAGLEVTRSYQLSTWLDGRTYLWSGRRARIGEGEGSSGLRFDYLEE